MDLVSRHARTLRGVIIGLSLAVACGALFLALQPAAAQNTTASSAEPDAITVQQARTMLGLKPQIICVAGCSTQDMTHIDTRLEHEAELRQSIATIRASINTLIGRISQLRNLDDAARLNPDNREALSQAMSAYEQQQTLLQSQLDQLQTRTVLVLSTPMADMLKRCLKNAHLAVPPEMFVLDRTDDEWFQIEQALLAEQRAQRMGHELSDRQRELLSTLRSDSSVITAKQRLQSELPVIQSMFE